MGRCFKHWLQGPPSKSSVEHLPGAQLNIGNAMHRAFWGVLRQGIGTPAAQHAFLNLGPPVQVNLPTVMPGLGDITYFAYVGPATLTGHMDTRSELALPATGSPSPDNSAAFLKAVLFLTGGPEKPVSSATLRCMQRETCEPHSHILRVSVPRSAGRPTSLVLGRSSHVYKV